MRPILIDADAFLWLRRVGLLQLLFCDAMSAPLCAVITGFVARHDLSSVWLEVQELARTCRLRVEYVSTDRNCPDGRAWLALKKAGADKGEAEAIAWATSRLEGPPPLFVSLDVRARSVAQQHRVESADAFDFLAAAVETGLLPVDAARTACEPWIDIRNQHGRPKGFTNFDEYRKTRTGRLPALV